jgi:hypothetical protein
VIEAVHDSLLRNRDSSTLMETLYLLYSTSNQHGLQFYFGIRLRFDDTLFELVKQHNLYAFIAGANGFGEQQEVYSRIPGDRVSVLFEYDEWVVEMEWKKLMETRDESIETGKQRKSPSIWKIRRAGEMMGVGLLAAATDRIPVCFVVLYIDQSCCCDVG